MTVANLRELTNGMVDPMLNLIAGCVDEDVTFLPVDPDADDHYATDDDNHLEQIAKIVRQAKAARELTPSLAR